MYLVWLKVRAVVVPVISSLSELCLWKTAQTVPSQFPTRSSKTVADRRRCTADATDAQDGPWVAARRRSMASQALVDWVATLMGAKHGTRILIVIVDGAPVLRMKKAG